MFIHAPDFERDASEFIRVSNLTDIAPGQYTISAIPATDLYSQIPDFNTSNRPDQLYMYFDRLAEQIKLVDDFAVNILLRRSIQLEFPLRASAHARLADMGKMIYLDILASGVSQQSFARSTLQNIYIGAMQQELQYLRDLSDIENQLITYLGRRVDYASEADD